MPTRFSAAAFLAAALATAVAAPAQSSANPAATNPSQRPQASSRDAGSSPSRETPRATTTAETTTPTTGVANSPESPDSVPPGVAAANAALAASQPATSATAAPVAPTTTVTAPTGPGTINAPQTTVSGTVNDPNASLQPGTTSAGAMSTDPLHTASVEATTHEMNPPDSAAQAVNPDGTPAAGLPPGTSTTAGAGAPPVSSVAELSTGVKLTALESGDVNQRLNALSHLEDQLVRSQQSLVQWSSPPPDSPARQRVDHAAALQDVRSRELQLRAALGAARSATGNQWPEASHRLTNEYQAYLQALQRAEALARPTIAAE